MNLVISIKKCMKSCGSTSAYCDQYLSTKFHSSSEFSGMAANVWCCPYISIILNMNIPKCESDLS